MTSWASYTRPVRQHTFREGYYQELPLGTFIQKDKLATVVSAYYKMKSKYSTSDYNTWIRNFLEKVPCHLVFFTDEEFAPFVEDARKNYKDRTKIIILPKSEWTSTTAFSESFWEKQAMLDPEKSIHSPDLYKVWYEKKDFIRRAIEMNPFDHNDFVWTDAGAFRDPDFLRIVCDQYPVASRIPTDRILLSNIMPFLPMEDRIHEIKGVQLRFPKDNPRIGASVIAGSKESWLWWIKIYDETLNRFHKAGLFVGKDQTIIASIVLDNKERISLLDTRQVVPDRWQYLPLYLGAPEKLYSFFRSEKAKSTSRMTYAQVALLK